MFLVHAGCHQQGHVVWAVKLCTRLTQANMYNGHKTVVVVVGVPCFFCITNNLKVVRSAGLNKKLYNNYLLFLTQRKKAGIKELGVHMTL